MCKVINNSTEKTSGEENLKRYLNDIEACGYILAQLYSSFCKWAEDNAEYKMKVSMKGALPIKATSDWRNKQGLTDKKMEELWISRHLSRHLDKPQVNKLARQQKCHKPFTLVDHGYDGTVSDGIITQFGNNKLETLLLAGGYKQTTNSKKRVFLSGSGSTTAGYYFADSARFTAILETMPNPYGNYTPEDIVKGFAGRLSVNAKKVLSPIGTQLCDAFYKGHQLGLVDSVNAVQSDDIEQFARYMNLLQGSRTEIISLFTAVYAATHPPYSELPPCLPNQNIIQGRGRVENIYKLGRE
jgi:hypothetical protein